MGYFDKVPVSDIAQLCVDVYDDPSDNILRTFKFNDLWVRVKTWTDKELEYMKDQDFKACLYTNKHYNSVILAIRGTVLKKGNILEDIDFSLDKDSKIFKSITLFFKLLNTTEKSWINAENKYVCGHSLGGILAKYSANIHKSTTVTFNSPGVLEYLKLRGQPTQIMSGKRVVTYYAYKDVIGNFHRTKDLGEHIPVILSANYNGPRILDNMTVTSCCAKIQKIQNFGDMKCSAKSFLLNLRARSPLRLSRNKRR